MDVRIGVSQTPREIDISLADDIDPDELKQRVEKALESGGTLWLTDRRGRHVGVVAEKLAYVEIGQPDSERRVGFGG